MRAERIPRRVVLLAATIVAGIPATIAAQTTGHDARLDPFLVRDLTPQWLVLAHFEPRNWQRNDSGYGLIDDRRRSGVVDDRPARDPSQAREQRTRDAARDIDLQHRLSEVHIAEGANGPSVTLETDHGDVLLSPTEYVRAVRAAQETQRSNGFLYVLFNITRPWGFVWVSAGFLAQALFTYRMILQWWASEKHKRSVVPVGYWWGSLFGGALLFAYFVWRKDIVGYLGQSTGVFIYARNLVLIYRGRRIEA
jgi:lipid-A-disaccharide synthase-like uncharacterized protein